MRLEEIAKRLDLRKLTSATPTDESADVTAGYASDLLSDVLANGPAGGMLVTIQVHMNVIAVAVHAGLAAVIFASNRIPDASVVEKAQQEGLALYVAEKSTFDVVGRLYELGLRGRKR